MDKDDQMRPLRIPSQPLPIYGSHPIINLVNNRLYQQFTGKPLNQNVLTGDPTGRNKEPLCNDFQVLTMSESGRLKNTGSRAIDCGCVNSLCWSSDDSLIVSGCDHGVVQLWDAINQKLLRSLYGHDSNVFSVLFHMDGDGNSSVNRIVSGGNDSDVRLYDIVSDRCTTIRHFKKKVLSMCNHHSMPHVILACSADGTVRLFDTRLSYKNTGTSHIETEEANSRFSLGYTIPQALGGGRSRSYYANLSDSDQNESLLVHFKDKSTLYSIDIHPLTGNQIIVSSSEGEVRSFDIRRVDRNKSSDSYVRVYNALENQASKKGYCDVTGCRYSYDGSEIVATYLGEYIYLFDTEEGASKVDSSSERSTVSLNSPESDDGEEVPYKTQFKGHKSLDTIKGVYFYGEKSQYVVSGSDEGNVYIWNKETGQVINVLQGHSDAVNTICPSNDPLRHPMIATSGIDDYVVLWSPNSSYPDEEEIDRLNNKIDKIVQENAATQVDFGVPDIFDLLVQLGVRMPSGDLLEQLFSDDEMEFDDDDEEDDNELDSDDELL